VSEETSKSGVKHSWQDVFAEPAQDPELLPGEDAGSVFVIPEDRVDDPREQTEWFARLPDHAKDEFREMWRIEEGQGKHQKLRRKHTTHQYVVEMAGVVAFFAILCDSPSLVGILFAPIVGGAAGFLAASLRASNWLYAVILTAGWLTWGAFFSELHFVFRMISLLLVVSIGYAIGTTRRTQKFDGTQL